MSNPVLFLPGLLQDARIFAPQIDTLSRDRSVMIAPTHLDERIEDLATRTIAAAPHRFGLVGLGLGGMAALEIMRKAADRVTHLCLISATGMADTPEGIADKDLALASLKGGRFADLLPAHLGLGKLANTQFKTEIAAQATGMATALGQRAFENQLRALQRRRDQQATLRKISCPTMCLTGDSDQIVHPKRMAFLSELIPGATLHTIDNASHFVTLEQPDAVIQALQTLFD